MGHLERGEKNLSFSSMTRVAGALHVTLSDLFLGLESGDESSRSRGGRAASVSRRELPLDRNLLLKEVLSLERTILALKELASQHRQPIAVGKKTKSVRPRRGDSA